MKSKSYIIEQNSKVVLENISTEPKPNFDKTKCQELLSDNIGLMNDIQSRLYAENKWGVLIIFQAMDTAGKDGAIKHVMTGFNPQGTQVHSFKKPSSEDLDHDYLWRAHKSIPERGNIGIFNRSYYEEVLVVKIHDLIKEQKLPENTLNDDIWKNRYRQINDFEKYLLENGIITIKFFLHISKDVQKKRLLSRIDDKAKNWKFSIGDIQERQYWNEYQEAYEQCIEATSTKESPWFIIPANDKWFARAAVSEVLIDVLNYLNPQYPTVSNEQKRNLELCKLDLMAEKDGKEETLDIANN